MGALQARYGLEFAPKRYVSLHSHNEKSFFDSADSALLDDLRTRECVYMSDAGMPCISDPGVALVRFLQSRGLSYDVLPGANALLLAAAASGIVEKEFVFLGFLPSNGAARASAISSALNLAYPAVIYEAPTRVAALVGEFARLEPMRQIFVIKEATKRFEYKTRGSCAEVAAILAGLKFGGEATKSGAKNLGDAHSDKFDSENLDENLGEILAQNDKFSGQNLEISARNLEFQDENLEILTQNSKYENLKISGAGAKNSQNLTLNGEWCVVLAPNPHASSEKITVDDITSLEISPKIKAKLLSKITGKSTKECYRELIGQ